MMSRVAPVVAGSLFLLLVAGMGTARAQTTFSDGTFLNADWQNVKVQDTTAGEGASSTNAQSATGGNPGAYRTVQHNWTTSVPGVSIAFVNLRQGAAYDPAALGGIAFVNYRLDSLVTSAPLVSAIGFGIALRQDNRYFFGGAGAATAGAGWQSRTGTLTQDDFQEFGGSLARPDFSGNGGVIEWGYYTANGGSGTVQTIQATGGVDNWSVSITAVPESATFPLLAAAAGAAALFTARRTRRQACRSRA
jgi:hypothetical protein